MPSGSPRRRLVKDWLHARGSLGNALELACGTGLWTQHLASLAGRLQAVDGSSAMLQHCRDRMENRDSPVTFEQADLFSWRPSERYDTVFFGFWLSHVPEERLESFWCMVASALRPGGRALLVDSLYDQRSSAKDHQLGDPEQTIRTRKLNDGREYRVVKVFRTPAELTRRLAPWGWTCQFKSSGRFFVYGEARR